MRIAIDKFGGLIPKADPVDLPPYGAQVADNCYLSNGTLRPWQAPFTVGPYQPAASNRYGIGKFRGLWLSNFTAQEYPEIVESPIAGDVYSRIYWTATKSADGETAYAPRMGGYARLFGTPAAPDPYVGGTVHFPLDYYDLGVPAPASAPSLAITGVAGGSTGQEFRAYLYTFVTDYGEESMPSAPTTTTAELFPGQTVNVSGIIDYAGSHRTNITKKRLYRAVTGATDTNYYLVAELLPGETAFADAHSNTSLGKMQDTASFALPPSTIRGLTAVAGGMLAGFTGNALYISYPYFPHAWPVENKYSFEGDVVAIGAFGNTVFVTTTRHSYLVTGTDPALMNVEKAENSISCVRQRTMVDAGDSLLYASPLGIAKASMSGFGNITQALIEPNDWILNYNPSFRLTHCSRYRNSLIFFPFNSDTSAHEDPLVLSEEGYLSRIDVGASFDVGAARDTYYDPGTGDLFMLANNGAGQYNIQMWDADDNNKLTYTWRSKVFRSPRHVNMGVAQVFADSYAALTFKLYADGVLKSTQTVTDSKPFRLPSGYRGRDYEIELVGTDTVQAVYVADSMEELRNA